MIVKREQKGIEIFLSWKEAEKLKKDLEYVEFYANRAEDQCGSVDLLIELQEIFTPEGT
jgi:hypothetical protein